MSPKVPRKSPSSSSRARQPRVRQSVTPAPTKATAMERTKRTHSTFVVHGDSQFLIPSKVLVTEPPAVPPALTRAETSCIAGSTRYVLTMFLPLPEAPHVRRFRPSAMLRRVLMPLLSPPSFGGFLGYLFAPFGRQLLGASLAALASTEPT